MAAPSAPARSPSPGGRCGAECIRWINLAQCEDSELGASLSRDAAYARLHARELDGRLLFGARLRRPLADPAGVPPRRAHPALPGVVQVLDWDYRGFLRLRRVWRGDAAVCPLPDKAARC